MQNICQLHPNFCKKRKKNLIKKKYRAWKDRTKRCATGLVFQKKKAQYNCAWQQDTELKNHMFSWGELGLPELADYKA